MPNTTQRGFFYLAGLQLHNEQSFVVRRFLQRFSMGQFTAQKAIAIVRILKCPATRNEDPDLFGLCTDLGGYRGTMQ